MQSTDIKTFRRSTQFPLVQIDYQVHQSDQSTIQESTANALQFQKQANSALPKLIVSENSPKNQDSLSITKKSICHRFKFVRQIPKYLILVLGCCWVGSVIGAVVGSILLKGTSGVLPGALFGMVILTTVVIGFKCLYDEWRYSHPAPDKKEKNLDSTLSLKKADEQSPERDQLKLDSLANVESLSDEGLCDLMESLSPQTFLLERGNIGQNKRNKENRELTDIRCIPGTAHEQSSKIVRFQDIEDIEDIEKKDFSSCSWENYPILVSDETDSGGLECCSSEKKDLMTDFPPTDTGCTVLIDSGKVHPQNISYQAIADMGRALEEINANVLEIKKIVGFPGIISK